MGQGPADCTELMQRISCKSFIQNNHHHNVHETSTQIKSTTKCPTSKKCNGVHITTFQPNSTIVFLFINLLSKFFLSFFFHFTKFSRMFPTKGGSLIVFNVDDRNIINKINKCLNVCICLLPTFRLINY